jgi:sulfite exporter TauE/SafE
MSYEFYNIVHVIGVIVLYLALGVLVGTGGTTSAPLRKLASIAHGVALAIVFVAGFGLLARLGHFGAIPLWAYLKMAMWALLAVIVVPIKRKPEWAAGLWLAMPLIGAVAIWLAVSQPF